MDVRKHLYHARINKHLSLQQVGTRTALSPSVLKNIDDGRFELLPSGVYARSYVRTFAAEVGLDPEATLAQLEHLLPGAPDPLPALNEMKSGRFDGFDFGLLEALRHLFSWLKETWKRVEPAPIALWNQAGVWPASLLNRAAPWPRTQWTPAAPWPTEPDQVAPWHRAEVDRIHPAAEAGGNDGDSWPDTVLDRAESGALPDREPCVEAVDRVAPWPEAVLHRVARWRALTSVKPWPVVSRGSAAVIDALVLLAVDALLVALISLSSGVGVESLLENSGWALGAFCAIPIALYFVLFEGIAGTTLGRWVCSLIDPTPDHPLTLPDILRRAAFR